MVRFPPCACARLVLVAYISYIYHAPGRRSFGLALCRVHRPVLADYAIDALGLLVVGIIHDCDCALAYLLVYFHGLASVWVCGSLFMYPYIKQ